jgi:hypothetical protein
MSLLALGVLVVLAAGAGATPGPGGWDNLGAGATPTTSAVNSTVLALDADASGALYVGGTFTAAGGKVGADYVARWSGGTWSALGSAKLNGAVDALAVHAGKIYVGGVFTNAGGNPDADFLAVWDGTKWGTPCKAAGSAITGNVMALQVVGSTLYVGGTFSNAAGIAAADALVACNLDTGAARATVDADGDIGGPVYALTADSKGNLYAGGGFIDLDHMLAADHVAYFDGGAWHAMGSGSGPGAGAVDTFVRSLAANGTDVYVGTDAVNVAGIAQADHVVRWNGSAWSALGANTAGTDGWFPTSFVNALAASGSHVFASGSFQNANGDPTADFIAFFDGNAWHPIGSNGAGNGALAGDTRALEVSGGKLYAGGIFTNAGANELADYAASYALANLSPGGGATTTPTASVPATGTATGAVTVDGRPFKSGPIAYNAKVDVTDGAVVLKTGTGTVRLFGSGVPAKFQLVRGTDRKPVTELRLIGGDFSACKRKTSGASASAPTKVVRQLWGNGKGQFRTRGRYAAATVRGTYWLTADRCDGTLTQVRRGTVQVSDLRLKKQVSLRAPKSYLAKP